MSEAIKVAAVPLIVPADHVLLTPVDPHITTMHPCDPAVQLRLEIVREDAEEEV